MKPEYIIQFGRYKGRPLKDVPKSYLEFLLKKNMGKRTIPEISDVLAYTLDSKLNRSQQWETT